ncbi:MAG: MFS transporter, partial [Anaerolineae bacterium]|nr:MFS transporter [Anaerolineae bacterium]
AYLSFIGLGLSGAMLGVAWPSMRETFALPLDRVGILLVTGMIGGLLAGFYSGPLISKIGVGRLLLVSAILRVVGLLGCGLAPAWWVIVPLGLATGLGNGVIDAGLNTYFAANHSTKLMNWLHACFGIGATAGPIVMQVSLTVGQSWRWGYVAAGLLHALFAVCFWLTRNRWTLAESPDAEPDAAPRAEAQGVRAVDTLKLPLVWVGVVLFFLFTGVENTTGQWSYSLLTEARSVAPDTAAFWASAYWGSLTVGRILFGFVTDWLGIKHSLRLAMLGVMGAAVLIWWNAVDLFGFLGLALMGFAVSPLFPLSVSATPKRVGAEHAANAIGFQIALGGLGFSLLPALAGVLAEQMGLEIIGPFLLVVSVAMFLLHEVAARRRLNNVSVPSRASEDGA